MTLVGRQVPRASPAGSPQEDEEVTESTAPVTCTSRMLGCDAGTVNPRHSLHGPSFLPSPFCTVLRPSFFRNMQREMCVEGFINIHYACLWGETSAFTSRRVFLEPSDFSIPSGCSAKGRPVRRGSWRGAAAWGPSANVG